MIQALAYVSEKSAPTENTRILLADQKAIHELLDQAQNIEALAIGNSHTQAINFEVLGYNGYTLARSGRDLFEVGYYLDGLLPKLPNVNTVFISVSYFSFQRDNAVSDELRIRRIHTYNLIPSWRFIKGDFANFVVGKIHPIFPVTSIVREDNWAGVFKAILSGVEAEESAKEDYHCGDGGLEYLTIHAKVRAAQHIQYTTDITANHANLTRDIYESMAKTIQVLQERNIRVIFFTPPYYEPYTRSYQSGAPQTIILMKQNMAGLQRKYGIEYYDFSTDREFASDYRSFANSDHLDSCSARQFSAKFKQIIAKHEP